MSRKSEELEVDETLIDEVLALTPEERLELHDQMLETALELRRGFQMSVSSRVEEKRCQREEDVRAQESGQKSAPELRAENGYFARDADIDWANAKP